MIHIEPQKYICVSHGQFILRGPKDRGKIGKSLEKLLKISKSIRCFKSKESSLIVGNETVLCFEVD